MNETKKQFTLLPEVCQTPWLWFLIFTLPQSLLCFFNAYNLSLIWEDLKPDQTATGVDIFVGLGLLIMTGLSLGIYSSMKNIPCSWKLHLGFLLAQVAYLWGFTTQFNVFTQSNVPQWIFPSHYFLYYQYLLILPGVFFNLSQIAAQPMGVARKTDLRISLGATVLIPLGFYLIPHLFGSFMGGGKFFSFFMVLLFVTLSILLLALALRTVLLVFSWCQPENDWRHLTLKIVSGWVLPFSGLLVNRNIPFPADFQSDWIYALTFLNGLLLLLPQKSGTRTHSFLWLFRCLFFPYCLYFFLVFLPFVPLSLPMLAAAGSGILILAPCFLFFVQLKQLTNTTRLELAYRGKAFVVTLTLLAIVLVPSLYTLEALFEKSVLMQGVQYVFSPDYQKQSTFQGNRLALKWSIENLKKFKQGVQMPLISPYYNWLVFDGMVLPEDKIDTIYHTFFGVKPSNPSKPLGFWGTPRQTHSLLNNGRTTAPSSEKVFLESVEFQEGQEGEMIRSRIHLKMKNSSDENLAQFETKIEIPEGVLVSGYWLTLGSKKLPGKIFEKKTALWVYNQITRTSRDPGILVYDSATRLHLRVYPFGPKEIRDCELELLYPKNWQPLIRIGQKNIELGKTSDSQGQPILMKGNADTNWVALSPELLKTLPLGQRKPYLHFIVDCSENSEDSFERTAVDIEHIVLNVLPVKDFKVTLANFEIQELTKEFIPLNELPLLLKKAKGRKLPFQGAFLAERAIKKALLDYEDQVRTEPGLWALRFPIFVLLDGKEEERYQDKDNPFSFFANITPEMPGYFRLDPTRNHWNLISYFDGKSEIVETPKGYNNPVTLLKAGQNIRAFIKGGNSPFEILKSQAENLSLEFYDWSQKRFMTLNHFTQATAATQYSKGLELWNKNVELYQKPFLQEPEMKALVQKSRDLKILTPKTSWIVVETQSQWNILEKKEKQALGANQVLEFEETQESPAPGIALLVPLLVFLLRRKTLKTSTVV